MTDRELMQQALEALIWTTGSDDFGDGGKAREGALKLLFPSISALRERLAQPEHHELQAKGEHPAPCARHCEATAFQIVIKNLQAQLAQPVQSVAGYCKKIEELIAERDELRERLAQPEQEPVLWRNAAIRVGEELSSVGPDGYYGMTAEQWLDWAMAQEPRGKNSLAQPEQDAVLEEREACAKVCEEMRPSEREFDQRFYVACTLNANAIRARGQDPMPLFDDWPGGWSCPPCNQRCNQGRNCPNA